MHILYQNYNLYATKAPAKLADAIDESIFFEYLGGC